LAADERSSKCDANALEDDEDGKETRPIKSNDNAATSSSSNVVWPAADRSRVVVFVAALVVDVMIVEEVSLEQERSDMISSDVVGVVVRVEICLGGDGSSKMMEIDVREGGKVAI
jgi:hypothetical protein